MVVLWCIQLVPQIWHNWRHKKTDGLPGSMMFLWALSAVPFGTYAVVQKFSIPLQVQPHVFCALALVSWAQILIYNSGWRTWTATLTGTATGATLGALEASLIVALRGPYSRGISQPVVAIGVVAAVLLALGLLPPYFEIWKRQGRVVGINFVFLSMDYLGAIFLLLSIVVQETFDVLGGILFIVGMVLESGIFTCHAVWLLRTRHLRREAKLAGETFDEYMARRHQSAAEELGEIAQKEGLGPMLSASADDEKTKSNGVDATASTKT